jgi:transcriptional regulator with XRE-family HTH domain
MDTDAEGRLDMQVLADRLRTARIQAGLTQTDLALRCGLNLPNLNALERGKGAGVRGETLVRLALSLSVSSDYLLGLTDDPRPRRRRPRSDDEGSELLPTGEVLVGA